MFVFMGRVQEGGGNMGPGGKCDCCSIKVGSPA